MTGSDAGGSGSAGVGPPAFDDVGGMQGGVGGMQGGVGGMQGGIGGMQGGIGGMQGGVADVLDAVPAAAVLIDPGGRICGWNAAAEVLYGRERAQVIGLPALDALFDPDDRAVAGDLLASAAAGRRWEGDARVRGRDGALLVSSFRLAPVGDGGGCVWVATDGIDQGLAEQERSVLLSAESAARSTAEGALSLLEAILDSAPVAIAVFDLDLRYVRVNDAYADLSGVTPDDHIGGRFGEVLPLREPIAVELRHAAATGRRLVGQMVEIDRRFFSVSYFPVRAAGGDLVGSGLSAVEITQLKRAEAERAVLLSRAEDARRRLSILATASTVLTTTFQIGGLIGRLARVLAPDVADWCAIVLFEGQDRIEHSAVHHRSPERIASVVAAAVAAGATTTTLHHVARSSRAGLREGAGVAALLALDVSTLPAGPERAALEAPLGSCLAVPIEARGEVLGVLALATDDARRLGLDDLELAADVAHRTALAVRNARAYQHERETAETLQRALLPAVVPVVEDLDLAVRYLAATDGVSVGGDWYDVLLLDGDTTGLVIGDVVGHDAGAATSMGQLRSALRLVAHEGYDQPALGLARVDRMMGPLGLPYATCIFGALHRPSGTFTWSNAGHPPPVLVRDGTPQVLMGGSGVLLGVTGGADADEDTVHLQGGDLLVLYTDGLIERRGESLEDGLARLGAVAASMSGRGAEDACRGILDEMLRHSVREDDVAILVAVVGARPTRAPQCRLPLEPILASVAAGRKFAVESLAANGWGAEADVAALLVSELLTNVVRHAAPPCALTIAFSPDSVEIAVEDGSPRHPTATVASPLDEGGRGLYLVDALAPRWGTRAARGGKAIWFALDRTVG